MAKSTRDLTISQQLARGPMDLPFLMLVMMLTVIGVIMVFSASYTTAIHEGNSPLTYFVHQAGFAALGIVTMYFAGKINYQRYRGMSIVILVGALVLLGLVLLPGVHTVRNDGVKRWIRGFGPLPAFQPSELAKLGVILYFSARMSKRTSQKKRRFSKRTYTGSLFQFFQDIGLLELIWPYGVVLGAIMLLMKLEPHMSGTILILIPAAAILWVGGIHAGWFGVGIPAAALVLKLGMSGYQERRMLVWKDPWSYPQDGGFQIIQSLYAIGSGGLFGVGFGQSRQSKLFLPEPENDFIFSIVCEELGMVGAGLILLLFLLLILRGYWISIHSRDRFGALLVVGIITLIAAQVILNISVVTNLIPTTGVSLPFFSYGGTALVIQLAEMGIVLGVSRQMAPSREG